MAKKVFFRAMPAVALVFVMAFAACSIDGSGVSGGSGTGGGSTYTVRFNVNTGTGIPPATESVSGGNVIRLPTQGGISNTGYAFAGWSDNPNWNRTSASTQRHYGGSFFSVNRDIVLYAVWLEYTDANLFSYDGTNPLTITGFANVSGNPTDIVIPSHKGGVPITAIEYSAFSDGQLTSVVIPNSVVSVGGGAFLNNQLTCVVVPATVSSFGLSAFSGNKLTSIVLPINVGNAPLGNFIQMSLLDNNLLASIDIPDYVNSIGPWAFKDNLLTSVVIPNSVTRIYSEAFVGNNITSVTIGAGVSVSHSDDPDAEEALGTMGTNLGFKTFYDNGGKEAGTYVYSNGAWSKR